MRTGYSGDVGGKAIQRTVQQVSRCSVTAVRSTAGAKASTCDHKPDGHSWCVHCRAHSNSEPFGAFPVLHAWQNSTAAAAYSWPCAAVASATPCKQCIKRPWHRACWAGSAMDPQVMLPQDSC